MKTLGDVLGQHFQRRGIPPPDPRSPEELERNLLERRLFSIERLEDTLAQLLPDDDRQAIAFQRELELANLQADVQATRPPGCWCLGLGGSALGSGRPYLPDDESPIPGWRVWCRCPDGQAQRATFSEQKVEARRREIQRHLDMFWGSVPDAFRAWNLDTLAALGTPQARLADDVRRWLEGDRWLYLWGPAGRGKTGAAIAALHALVGRGATGLYAEVRDLLWHLRSSYADVGAFAAQPDQRWDQLQDVEVLILDDLGAERRTDWANETLGQLVAIRHRRLRRTVITSNLNLADLAEHLGDGRTTSRIYERAEVLDCSILPNLRLERRP
jgi:DNA replication protein DnaC